MAAVTEATGVPHAESNRACAQSCKYLILAVKPQYFDVVFDEIREVLEEDQVVISLAPGQTISSLKERLGDEIRVVRAMPNTPAMLGAGMTGIAFGTDPFTEEEKESILQMLIYAIVFQKPPHGYPHHNHLSHQLRTGHPSVRAEGYGK